GSNHQRMWRCSKREVRAIDLPSCRTAADETEIPNPLVGPDPAENEGRPRIETLWRSFIIGRPIKTLRGHARAGHGLRRPSHAPLHPPEFTGEAVVVLTTLGEPRANAVLATAHF